LGFDIEVWLTVLRGRTLVMLDRIEEARPFLDRVLQLESSQVDLVHYVMPSMAYVDVAWAEENVGLAQEHADRAFAIAIKSGNPYLRVYAQACRGFAHVITGRYNSAIEDLSDALSFARSRKAGLENEPRILADLANAHRLNGDNAAALSTVEQAIKVAVERHARVPECLARIVRADLLLRSTTSDQKAEGRQELECAIALMRETGAMLFETFIRAINVAQDNASRTFPEGKLSA
jgi:tetratricopeptide (TPR) repeat protein